MFIYLLVEKIKTSFNNWLNSLPDWGWTIATIIFFLVVFIGAPFIWILALCDMNIMLVVVTVALVTWIIYNNF